MSTNNDARARAVSEADRQMVRPTVEFSALLKHAGATKDILSFREVMYYLGQYIMKKQLYDQTDLHIVHCSGDALGKVLGVERFSVKETGPLYTMITNNLVLVRTQEPSNTSQQHSQPDRPPDRPPEVKIQETSCPATQSRPDRPPEDSDADSTHSTSGSRRRRRSEPGPSQRHDGGDEDEDEDGERKRRRADSYSLTFDNSMSWCVIEELRNGQDRVRHSSQSSDANSLVSNRSDRSDHFSVEFEVESIESDDVDDLDEETSISDDEVYEVTIYEDDDTDEDTEITEADYWRCLKCEELNPPLPRNCNRCWSLRQDWLRDVLPRAIPSTNPSPLPPTPSPGPPKPASAECPGVEEDGIDVPDGRRTTPLPCETPSPGLSSQEFSQTSSIAPTSSLTLASTHLAADPGSDLCVICQSEPKNGCIVHGKTGHLMACFRCARKLKRRNKVCPVCREPIQAVVKTFFC